MSGSAEVVIAGQTLELVPPKSLWERRKIMIALGSSVSVDMQAEIRAAALFICWKGRDNKQNPAPPVFLYGMSLHAYGATVLDYLMQIGAQDTEIRDASIKAIELVHASIPTPKQQEEARGNSQAPSGG